MVGYSTAEPKNGFFNFFNHLNFYNMETNKEYYQAQVNKIITTGEYAPIVKIYGQNGEGDTKHININKESAQVLINWLQLIVDKDNPKRIEFTRVNNDVNGNPRYVCHFLELINEDDDEVLTDMGGVNIDNKYKLALKRAKKIGGRKFHNKQYGGGIVFQSYNIKETERKIFELLEKI